jgi:phosphatidate cytidylyltransferase
MNIQTARIITGLCLAGIVITLYLIVPAIIFSILIACALIFIVVVEWPAFNLWWLTPLYPIAPFIILIALNHATPRWLLPLTILMVSTHDMGAYFFGRLYGKHLLCPTISPGKTWEGLAGGFFLSISVSYVAYSYFQLPLQPFPFLLLTLCINSVAVAGDLFESMLKRQAHLKDSGTLLPGHGGLLDRLDSLLFASIIMYGFCRFFL